MPQKAKRRAKDDNVEEEGTSTSMLVDRLMQQAREQVAKEFLDACGKDNKKQAVILGLCHKVLGHQRLGKVETEEESKEEGASEEESEEENIENEDDENAVHDESDEDDSDDDSIPNMREIREYPYESNISAETGELPFEDFKDLLDPDGDDDEQHGRRKPSLAPTKEAIETFGVDEAKKLVNWHYNVKHSGQLYSTQWLEGEIRDNIYGIIAKPMLLMCLQDYRIGKAVNAVLGKICEDLELQATVKEALEVWGVADTFPAVWGRDPGSQYTDNVKACRQREIFLARAYVCLKTLKHTEVSDDLGHKLMSCFQYMENHLPEELAKKRFQRKIAPKKQSKTTKGSPSKTAEAKVIDNREPILTSPTSDIVGDEQTIQQVDIETGKVLQQFSSLENIIAHMGDMLDGSKEPKRYIAKALRGEQRSACGFFWQYETKKNPNNPISKKATTLKGKRSRDGGSDGNPAPNRRLDEKRSPLLGSKTAASKETDENKSTKQVSGNEPIPGNMIDSKVIEQVHMETGSVLGRFSSMDDILNRIGDTLNATKPKKNIAKVLRGEQKSACGFFWRWEKKKWDSPSSKGTASKKSKEIKNSVDANDGNGRDDSTGSSFAGQSGRLDFVGEKSSASKGTMKRKSTVQMPSSKSTADQSSDGQVIEQINLKTGEVLREFRSMEQVVKKMGRSLGVQVERLGEGVNKALTGKQKSCGGDIRRYKKDLTVESSKENENHEFRMRKRVEDESSESRREGSPGPHQRLEKVSLPLCRGEKKKNKTATDDTPMPIGEGVSSSNQVDRDLEDILEQCKSIQDIETRISIGNEYVIEQVNQQTQEVTDTFTSIQLAVDFIEKSLRILRPKETLSKILRGKQRSCGGFIWRFTRITRENKSKEKKRSVSRQTDGSREKQLQNRTRCQHAFVEKGIVTQKSPNQFLGKRKASNELNDPKGNKFPRQGEIEAREIGQSTKEINDGPSSPARNLLPSDHHQSAAPQNVASTSNPRGLALLRKISFMAEIEESPYLREQNAEVGEEMFDSFKDMLKPANDRGRHLEASQSARELFSEALADRMVTASEAIAKAGMVYGADWKEGKIHRSNCGYIPKPTLLLCLQEQRLASGSKEAVGTLVVDLKVCELMEEALRFWNLESLFPSLVGMKNLNALHSKTKALMGCIIFVARSYRCMKLMKRKRVSDSVMKKVQKCLSLVHNSVELQLERKKKAKEKPQTRNSGAGGTKKTTEAGLQKENKKKRPHNHRHGSKLSRFDHRMDNPEVPNPGILNHDLFANPVKLSAVSLGDKGNPALKPQNNTTSPSSTTGISRTTQGGSSKEQVPLDSGIRMHKLFATPTNRNGKTKTKPQKSTNPPSSAMAASRTIQGRNPKEQAPSKMQAANQPTHHLLQAVRETPNKPENTVKQTQQRAPMQQTRHQPPQDYAKTPASRVAPTTNEFRPRVAHGDHSSQAPAAKQSNDVAIPTAINNISLPTVDTDRVPHDQLVPADESGLLNGTENELAWLTTECTYALRLSPPAQFSWDFIWEYASPGLKVALRAVNETRLDKLVRLDDGLVRTRFEGLKEKILFGLQVGQRRLFMKDVIKYLRHQSRLANRG